MAVQAGDKMMLHVGERIYVGSLKTIHKNVSTPHGSQSTGNVDIPRGHALIRKYILVSTGMPQNAGDYVYMLLFSCGTEKAFQAALCR